MYNGMTEVTPETVSANVEAYQCSIEMYNKYMLLGEYERAENEMRNAIDKCVVQEAYPQLYIMLKIAVEKQRPFIVNLWHLITAK